MPKARVWEYKGDMRCPSCGMYSPVNTNGRGESLIMRLTCKHHGVWYKDMFTGWMTAEGYQERNERFRLMVKAIKEGRVKVG